MMLKMMIIIIIKVTITIIFVETLIAIIKLFSIKHDLGEGLKLYQRKFFIGHYAGVV